MFRSGRGLLLTAACGLLLQVAPLAAQGPAEAGGDIDAPRAEREARSEEEPIETDRDSFTPATSTAGRGRLIVEAAYSFLDHRGLKETHSFPELILRYGLTERIELRLGWNYEVGGAGNDVSGADASGDGVFGTSRLERLSRLSYGVTVQVTEQDRWLPRSVVIVQAATPTSGESTATDLAVTSAAGWVFPNRWRLDTAFRWLSASERGDRFSTW